MSVTYDPYIPRSLYRGSLHVMSGTHLQSKVSYKGVMLWWREEWRETMVRELSVLSSFVFSSRTTPPVKGFFRFVPLSFAQLKSRFTSLHCILIEQKQRTKGKKLCPLFFFFLYSCFNYKRTEISAWIEAWVKEAESCAVLCCSFKLNGNGMEWSARLI